MADKKKTETEEGSAEAETPSAIANATVGEPAKGASDEELAEVAQRWNLAKRRAHRGF